MTDSITTIDISVDSDDKFNIESTGRNSYELESTAFPGAIAGLQVVPGTAPPCIDIRHVNVPKEYRGKGVAETLVLKVVAVARARGMKIVPTCPYVSDTFFPRNPDIAAELKA
jgi:predicted GNAT family acetyltransferase